VSDRTWNPKRAVWPLVKFGLLALAIGTGVYLWWLAPVPVTRHLVRRGEMVVEVMGTGTLETHVKATISPKISGLITEVRADQGDRVKAGQTLVILDDRDLKRQVEASEASVAAAEASVKRQETDRKRAAAILENASRYASRLDATQGGAVSQTDRDKGIEALAVAQAGIASADAAIVEGQKQLASAERIVDYQRARLSDTIIVAPCDGLIVRRDRDPGSVVVPGSSILSLVSTEKTWVSAWVDETEMARLHEGQPARVFFRSEPARSYKGEVARLGREADRETREFLVDVLVRELPANWAIGQRAEVYIETNRKPDTAVLPSSLLLWRGAGPGLFVEREGRATWRSVRIGLRGRDTVEVLEGVQAGESAIAPEAAKTSLREGQRVRIR